MLDLSTSQKIKNARHWTKEINQLYHPTGEFGQDTEKLVYSSDSLNTTKFAPILLKEWFFLVEKDGYLVIDYKPNKICDWEKLEKYMWSLWKGKYEIIFHGAIDDKEIDGLNEEKLKKFIYYYEEYYKQNLDIKSLLPKPLPTEKNPKTQNGYLRFICKKIRPTKIEGDSIDKWTLGIITNGKRLEWLEQIIESIRKQRIPAYEIIICGSYFDRQEDDIRYIPFNQRDELGWITKKKNLIVKAAKYENICIIHDRIIFNDDWYEGMKKWGNCFEHLACIQSHNNQRVNDWGIHEELPGLEFSCASLLDYRDWDKKVYQAGQLHIVKKSYISKVLWDESYLWMMPEDLKVSNDLRDEGYLLRCNIHSGFNVLSYRLGNMPEVVFDKFKLSNKRKGNIIRIYSRRLYCSIYRFNILKKISLSLSNFFNKPK